MHMSTICGLHYVYTINSGVAQNSSTEASQLLNQSVMIPVVMSPPPAVIAGPSNNDNFVK